MRTLNDAEMHQVTGGKIKLHFNVFHAVFAVLGAGLTGGPVGAGIAVGALIAAQGAGTLHDMYASSDRVHPSPPQYYSGW